MPSSGSTLNRTAEAPVRLFLWVAREDHPKACTGRRLLRRGLVHSVGDNGEGLDHSLLLDPVAKEPLGMYDSLPARRGGILAVDCSWNRLSARGGYPEGARWLRGLRHRRRLPWLVATNPQHFGRVGELTTAEAFGATLWLLGDHRSAHDLLDGFAGGPAFFEVNRARLSAYAGAGTPKEMLGLEAQQF